MKNNLNARNKYEVVVRLKGHFTQNWNFNPFSTQHRRRLWWHFPKPTTVFWVSIHYFADWFVGLPLLCLRKKMRKKTHHRRRINKRCKRCVKGKKIHGEVGEQQVISCPCFSNRIKVRCVFYFLISLTMYSVQVCGRAGGSALVCGLGSAGKTPDNPKLINTEHQLKIVWSTCAFRLAELNMKLWKLKKNTHTTCYLLLWYNQQTCRDLNPPSPSQLQLMQPLCSCQESRIGTDQTRGMITY